MLWMFIFHLEYFLSCKNFCNIDEKKYFFLNFFSHFSEWLNYCDLEKVFIIYNIVYSRNKFGYPVKVPCPSQFLPVKVPYPSQSPRQSSSPSIFLPVNIPYPSIFLFFNFKNKQYWRGGTLTRGNIDREMIKMKYFKINVLL